MKLQGQDGNYVALFYADFHPRSRKTGGWMTSFKPQQIKK